MFRLATPLLSTALILAPASMASAQWGILIGPLARLGQIGQIAGGGAGAPTQVFSANPVGLMVEFYNFEYELKVSDNVTAGAGASRLGWRPFGGTSEPYVNSDVFVRYYAGGRAFNGFTIGLKGGPTKLPGDGTYWGIGFDVNHSTALTDHFVVSTGFGLKRLFRPAAEGSFLVPTWRIINVGVGF